MSIMIRKMEKADRIAIRRICCATGLFGASMNQSFDQELFADTWTLYYTDYEPQSAFVAQVEGRVVGYLLGCLDTKRFNRMLFTRVVPKILTKTLLGRYKVRIKTINYLLKILISALKGEMFYPPLESYPAHLHINIEEGYRRQGIGQSLMESYLAYLKGQGVRGVHLGTTSLHKSALPFYEKLGFRVYDKRESSFLQGLALEEESVYSIVYIKELT